MDNKRTDKCPLCGADNQCAMAAGKPPETCWCMTTEISAATLATLPESERGVRCICPICANSERKDLER